MQGGEGRWGREIDGDDDLRGTSSAGWEKLELDPSARPSAASFDPLAHGGGRIVGDPFDGLGPSAEPPPLELDAPAPRSAPAAQAPQAPAPSAGASPDWEPDPAAVRALADYGPAPRSFLGAVPYALLVLTRRRALSAALADLQRLERNAARDLEEAMIALGRALHAERDAPALAPLAARLTAADEAGRIAGQRTEEWQRARAAAEAQRASLAAKIEEAERAAAPHRDRETKLATQMNVRETDLRRAEARLARVEIELRNLAASTRPDAARRQVLEAERQARRAEVEAAQAKVDELAPKLAEARRELAVVLAAIHDLVEQRRKVDAAEARADRLHLSAAGEAERAYHAAVIELAREAERLGIAQTVAPDPARKAERMRAAHETRAREVKMHEAALAAYDPTAFRRGAAVIAAAALLVVVTLLFVVLR